MEVLPVAADAHPGSPPPSLALAPARSLPSPPPFPPRAFVIEAGDRLDYSIPPLSLVIVFPMGERVGLGNLSGISE